MIEAHELRLGNYISREDIGDVSIRFETVLELHQNKVVTSGPLKIVLDYGDLKTIQLTEEILLKCGFKEYKLNDDLGYALKKEVCGIFFKYDIVNSEAGVYVNHQVINVKYLHQLQNLYFELTNQELEINL